MLFSYAMAIAQLGDRRYRKLLWRGVLLSSVILFILYAVSLLVAQVVLPGALMLPGYGVMVEPGAVFSLGTLILLPWLSMFLMVPAAALFTVIYLDDVADAVEDEHYRDLPPPSPVPVREAITEGVNSFGLLIGLNFLAMAVFFFSNSWGVATLWLLNGFLLSREYFTMIARRRNDAAAARAAFDRHSYALWLPGVFFAMGLSVPFLNLAMPLVGAAVFTHLYHRLNPVTADEPQPDEG